MKLAHAFLCIAVAACSRAHHDDSSETKPAVVVKSSPPLRDAVGDRDMRALISDLASSKACEQFEHSMKELLAENDPARVTGVLWIRRCHITLDGNHMVFELGGNGWQWNETTKHQAGGTFVVKQWVKFGVDVVLTGSLDLAYDRADHVVSVWFTPIDPPSVRFTPVGDISVDSKGAWSSIVGSLGSIFGKSPHKLGAADARKQGLEQFQKAFAQGFSITANLCTSEVVFSLLKKPKGTMDPPEIGQTEQVAAELQPNGVMMFGPFPAPAGMSIDAVVEGGSARLYLACLGQAEQVAQAFLDNRLNHARPLAAEVVSGHAKLKAPPGGCRVAVVARSILPKPVMIRFARPLHEATQAAGGPIVPCGKPSSRL
jgi:hypothetical protein